MRGGRWLVVLVVAGLLAGCSGGDGGVFDTSAGASTTTVPGESTTSVPGESTTTTLAGGVGVVEEVFPEEGSLSISAELGIVPVDLLLVAMEVGRPPADAEAVAAAVGGTVVGRLEAVDSYQIRFPGTSEADLLAALEAVRVQPGVVLAVPEGALFGKGDTCESHSVLDESSYGEGNNARPVELIGMEEAWAIVQASGVTMHGAQVGVVDTRLSSWSPEVGEGSAIEGLTAADTTADPVLNANGNPRSGGLTHGTRVAQVAGANPDNGGIAGVGAVPGGNVEVTVASYQGGPLTPVAVAEEDRELLELYQQDGQGFTYNSMAAVLRQIRDGATVINMSYGSDYPAASEGQHAAYYRLFLERMYAKYPKVVFVAAAGNEGDTSVGLDGQNYAPGGLPVPNLITVGGLTKEGGRVPWSNFEVAGGEVTLAAPAENIPVGVGADGRTVLSSGTSFATPMVASAAALMKSINPELTADQVKQILVETAYAAAPTAEGGTSSPLIPENVGGGLLRVDEAVLRVINDLRAQAQPPLGPLDKDTLLGLARLQGQISPTGPGGYDIFATVEQVRPDGTTGLSAELLGQGLIEGDSIQPMPYPGDATWALTITDPTTPPTVRVCRTDITACCNLAPQPPTLDGHYQGTVTTDWATTDCPAILNTPFTVPFWFDLVTNPDGTGTANVTADIGGGVTGAAPVTWSGDQFQIQMGEAQMVGAIEQPGSAVTIGGTFTSFFNVTTSDGTVHCPVSGVWEVTRTG